MPGTRHNTDNIRSRRGVVLILVLVVLLLIVVLGIVYMNVARLDRLASRNTNAVFNDQATDLAVHTIRAKLEWDVIGADDGYLNGAPGIHGNLSTFDEQPISDFFDNQYKPGKNSGSRWSRSAAALWAPVPDEPYDYPWTKADDRTSFEVWSGADPRGDRPDFGGDGDDNWLAELVPDFSRGAGAGVWRHTSDVRLRYPRGGTGSHYIDNVEYLIGAGFQPTPSKGDLTEIHHEDLDILNVDGDMSTGSGGADWDPDNPDADGDGYLDFERWAADADGDGIPDSRWTYMPTRQFNDVIYIWAVRVVDLSGKANVNVATALSDGSGGYSNAHRPQFDTPSELDLALLASDTSFVGSGSGTSNLAALLGWRTGSSAMPTPRSTRVGFWEGAGRRPLDPTSSYNLLGLDSEIDLLYRNGLNHPEISSQIEDYLGTWLRGANLDERSWSAADPSNITTIQEYFTKNPRLYLTTRSGSSIYHGLPNMPASARMDIDGSNFTNSPTRTYHNQSHDDSSIGTGALWKAAYDKEKDLRRSAYYYLDNPYRMSWEMRRIFDRNVFVYGPDPYSNVKANAPSADRVPYGHIYNTMTPKQQARASGRLSLRRQELANQLAASFADYLDDDGTNKTRVTVIHDHADSSNTYNTSDTHPNDNAMSDVRFARMGMERLPFVTEVYNHWPFRVDVDSAGAGHDPTNHKYAVRFKRRTNSSRRNAAWVIEIKNPHPTAVGLDGIYLNLMPSTGIYKKPGGVTNAMWVGYDNATTPAAGNNYTIHLGDYYTSLDPGEVLYVYRNSNADPSGLDILAHTGIAAGAKKIEWPTAGRVDYDQRELGIFDRTKDGGNYDSWIDTRGVVQLYVRAQDGRIPKWPYNKIEVWPLYRPNWIPSQTGTVLIEYDDPATSTPDDPNGETFYMAQAVIGNGNGLNCLKRSPQVTKRGGGTNVKPFGDGTGDYDFNNSVTGRFRQYDNQDWTGGSLHPIHPTNSVYNGSAIDLSSKVAFGLTDKTGKGGPPDLERDLDNADGDNDTSTGVEKLADEVWPIGNYGDGRFRSPTEPLKVLILGPKAEWNLREKGNSNLIESKGVAEMFWGSTNWGTSDTFLGHFMIDIDNGLTQKYDGLDSWPVDFDATSTFAWIVNRFDPLSPVDDLIDNDGDGLGADIDNSDVIEDDELDRSELLVPGRLNLNTAPEQLLQRIIPIPDAGLRARVARRIVLYRENRTVSGTPWRERPKPPLGADWTDPTAFDDSQYGCGLPAAYRDEPGIVHVGELIPALDRAFMDDTDDDTLNGITIDADGPDGGIDDREERLRLTDWLMSTCSARSDFFAAYIVIRGYKNGQFDQEPVTDRRIYAIFDRSELIDRFTPARILAVVEVDGN